MLTFEGTSFRYSQDVKLLTMAANNSPEGSTSSVFEKIANEVLQATERISNSLDDGISLLLNGELAAGGGSPSADSSRDAGAGQEFASGGGEAMNDDELVITEEELAMMGSPLDGIANSVLGDIMAGQVRKTDVGR